MAVLAGNRLLSPERRFASFIVERQRTHRTPPILRMERNYGPEGIAFMAASILSGLAGAAVGCTGFVLLLTSQGHGNLLHTGYYLMLAGIALECLAMTRAVQGIYAGRRFRVNRAFLTGSARPGA
jgi:hypothetical protein